MKKLILLTIAGILSILASTQLQAALTPEQVQDAINVEDAWLKEKYLRERGYSKNKNALMNEKANEKKLNNYLKAARQNNKITLKAWYRMEYPLYDFEEYSADYEDRPIEKREKFVNENNKLKYFYETGKIR